MPCYLRRVPRFLFVSRKAVSKVAGPRLRNPTRTLARPPRRVRAKTPPKKLSKSKLARLGSDSKTRVFFHAMIPQMRRSVAHTGLAQITKHPSHASAGEVRNKIERTVACILFM